jgi:hypothetical protein
MGNQCAKQCPATMDYSGTLFPSNSQGVANIPDLALNQTQKIANVCQRRSDDLNYMCPLNGEFEMTSGDNCEGDDGCNCSHHTKCEDSNCGTANYGYGLNCTRKTYNGDSLECCLNKVNVSKKYKTGEHEAKNAIYTCSPGYTDSTSQCGQVVGDYCAANLDQWSDNGYCTNYMNGSNNLDNKATVLKKTTERLSVIPNILQHDGRAPYLKNILNFCKSQPLGCQTGLMTMCKDYTMDEIYNAHTNSKNSIVNQNLSSACSCHLDDSQFKPPYTPIGSIPQVCTPLCNAAIPPPIPYGFNNDRGYATCDQNVCVMNGINVNLTNSPGTTVNVDQVCGNCTDGQCACYLDTTNIKGAESAFNKINYTQKCGQCKVRDPISGLFKQIPCLDVKSPSGPSKPSKGKSKSTILIALIVFFIVLFLIIGFLIFIYVEN